MTSFPLRSLLVTVGAASMLAVGAATAQGRGDQAPMSTEIAQLPRFCWNQFQVPGAQGPEYVPAQCGYGTNHYCYGLVSLIRAKHYIGKGKPTGELGRADQNVHYTEEAIKNFPQCSIREHVAATRVELNTLMRLYGMKVPPSK